MSVYINQPYSYTASLLSGLIIFILSDQCPVYLAIFVMLTAKKLYLFFVLSLIAKHQGNGAAFCDTFADDFSFSVIILVKRAEYITLLKLSTWHCIASSLWHRCYKAVYFVNTLLGWILRVAYPHLGWFVCAYTPVLPMAFAYNKVPILPLVFVSRGLCAFIHIVNAA